MLFFFQNILCQTIRNMNLNTDYRSQLKEGKRKKKTSNVQILLLNIYIMKVRTGLYTVIYSYVFSSSFTVDMSK